MCGIAGFLSLHGTPPDAARLAAMVATLRHRGPDDSGMMTDAVAAIGAARLSIIDVAGGHQPMTIDGITVAQNGEIYNYVELRDELADNGRVFRTHSDTEVIAHLYAVEGVRAFERLRGMFAIAIWDAPQRRLVLARDRVGKKPLYWLERNGQILFASETKAILAALDSVPPVDASALLDFFTFGYVAGRHAAFAGMRRIAPGSALVVDAASGQTREETYWRWPSAPAQPIAEREAIERLRSELDEAVRIRLRSDVPLGAFLSGGMDSAAVLALMARHGSKPVKTFTIGFGDSEYDELVDARATAAHCGANHHEDIVKPDCVHVAETLAYHYDEPFADASAIPTFYVARLARQHVTVCLTGDGGDELFAGYTTYADALARAGWAGTEAWRALVGAGARYVPVHARGKGRLSTMALGPEGWFVWRRTVFPDYLLQAVVDGDVQREGGPLPEHTAVAALRDGRNPLLARLQSWDAHHYLPDDILVKVDRATMAHSLEARCPLLDHRVVELAAAQPAARHGDAHGTKRLFRDVIKPWVPTSVLTRPKRGFGVPLRRWFHDHLTSWTRDILLDPRTMQRGWTRGAAVRTLLDQHENGSRDHAKRLWALVCLELWARCHVDRAGSVERACA